jgi:hypothetical protein
MNLPTASQLPYQPPSNGVCAPTPHTPLAVGTGPTGGLEPPASPDREENLQRKPRMSRQRLRNCTGEAGTEM